MNQMVQRRESVCLLFQSDRRASVNDILSLKKEIVNPLFMTPTFPFRCTGSNKQTNDLNRLAEA